MGIFLFGVFLIYLGDVSTTFTFRSFTESVSVIHQLRSGREIGDPFTAEQTNLITWGLFFVITSFFFKLAVFPFHFWSIDVYEGTPMIITFSLSVVVKIGVLFAFMKVLAVYAYIDTDFITSYLLIAGLISIAIGSFGCISQTTIKRFVAYTSVSHLGFIILGLGTFSLESWGAVIFYLLSYCIINSGIFFILGNIRNKSNNQPIIYINELSKFSSDNPVLAKVFITLLFSSAGAPPLLGFFGKYLILHSLFLEGYYITAILSIFFSLISLAGYLRIVKVTFFEQITSKSLKKMNYGFDPAVADLESTGYYFFFMLNIFAILYFNQLKIISSYYGEILFVTGHFFI